MENRTYYYARVSTKEQNLDRQLNAFRQLGATDRDIVTDKESGKSLWYIPSHRIGRFAVASANGYLIEKTAILSLLFLYRSH